MEINKNQLAAMDQAGELPHNERRSQPRPEVTILVQKHALIPEGYVLVPLNPTPKMIDATFNHPQEHERESHNKRNRRIWDAMIAVAIKEQAHG